MPTSRGESGVRPQGGPRGERRDGDDDQVTTTFDTGFAASDAGSANLTGTTASITANLAPGQPTNFWVSEGPGPGINGQENVPPDNQIGGAIQAFVVDPTNPNIMYVGAVNGGIWKTTNATASSPHWVPLTDNLPSLSIGALALDPTDPTHQTLIAGIGAVSSYGATHDQLTGVLRSTDGGATWSQLGTVALAGDNITSVAARGTTLVAAAESNWGFSRQNGLFRSTDSGATWTLISDGTHGLPNLQSVSDVEGDPLNSNVLYAAVTGTGGGIFRSTGTGQTWTNISSGIGIIGSATDKIELAVHHDATNLDVFAFVDNSGILGGVFRSVNGGSFVALDVPSGGIQGNLHGNIAADPSNPNIAYVGYGGGASHYLTRIDASKPSGSQITDISGGTFGSPHVDVRDMQIDANGNLILGTDGGLFRLPTPTVNTGAWSAIVGDMSVFEVHDIAYDHITHTLMVGTQDNGTLSQQTPGGATWNLVGFGDGGDVVIDDVSLAALGESVRYFSSQNLLGWTRQVYDSTNHLVSSTPLSATPPPDDEDDISGAPISDPQFTTPVELNAVDPTRLLVGGSAHIYESHDQGTTLTSIANVGVNGIVFNGGGVMVYGGFQGGVADADLIYAASGANVLRQTAAGGGFTTTLPGGGGTIRGVTDNPTNWATVFTIDDNQVFESTTAGAAWLDVTANLTSISAADFRSIAYVHGTFDDALVVGTSSGVFYAHVSGLGGAASWSKFGSNLPDVIAYDLDYDAADNVLVAGTFGRGAWQVNNATSNLGISNLAPVLDAAGGSLSYTENQAATAIDTVLTASDADSANLTSATVTISGNFAAGEDVLGFTDQNGITGSYNGATGVLTLSGESSVANYQTALRSVTYFNSSDNPSTATRTISYQVDDGAAANDASNVVTATVAITAVEELIAGWNYAGSAKRSSISADAAHGVLANVTDQGGGDALRVSSVQLLGDSTKVNVSPGQPAIVKGTYGRLTLRADGSYSYAANARMGALPAQTVPQDIFSYVVQDGAGNTTTADLTITVFGPGRSYAQAGTADTLTAGKGQWALDGGDSNHTLVGGRSSSWIMPGRGNDTLVGGDGPDIFAFGPQIGNDVIKNFDPSKDLIQFNTALLANYAAVMGAETFNGHATTITAGTNETVTIENMAPSSLTASSFRFV
jgi:VCBS repeat-containing protein